jgi:hypothetical protein
MEKARWSWGASAHAQIWSLLDRVHLTDGAVHSGLWFWSSTMCDIADARVA